MPLNSYFMKLAIGLAERGMRQNKGGPFGAVVVRRGKVIGRGFNSVISANDPTAHAEVVAIREACRREKSFMLEDCEIYASCEPCPMCLAAIYWARIRRVYYANTREDAASIGFDDAIFYEEINLPRHARTLPMKRLLASRAIKTFEEWRAKPDKVEY